jgi:hypothetical protein
MSSSVKLSPKAAEAKALKAALAKSKEADANRPHKPRELTPRQEWYLMHARRQHGDKVMVLVVRTVRVVCYAAMHTICTTAWVGVAKSTQQHHDATTAFSQS